VRVHCAYTLEVLDPSFVSLVCGGRRKICADAPFFRPTDSPGRCVFEYMPDALLQIAGLCVTASVRVMRSLERPSTP
jgi:hypothetical protein